VMATLNGGPETLDGAGISVTTRGGLLLRSITLSVSGGGFATTFTVPLSSMTLLSFTEMAIWANAGDASSRTTATSMSLMTHLRKTGTNDTVTVLARNRAALGNQVRGANATTAQRPAAWAPRSVMHVLMAYAARFPSASITSHSTRPTVLPPFFSRAVAVSVPCQTGRKKLIFISSVV